MLNFLRYYKEKKLIGGEVRQDEKGRALIEIEIKDKSEVLSPFYAQNKETINNQFANFLDNFTKSFPPRQELHLSFNCLEVKPEDEEVFSRAVKNYYLNSTIEAERKIANNTKLLLVMILLSIISLTALFLVHYFGVFWLIEEVFDIIAWVFVWEAVDIFAFQRSLLRYEKQRNLSLYNSFISFDNKNKNNENIDSNGTKYIEG